MLVTKSTVRLPRGLQARHTTLFVRKAISNRTREKRADSERERFDGNPSIRRSRRG